MTDEASYGNREIADLLPWYATGRLAAPDRQRVEAALASDPALRQELALVREERTATVDVNEAQCAPSRHAADRFFAALDASPKAQPRFSLARMVADRLAALRPHTLAWGAMAALALVLLQGGLIAHLMSTDHRVTTYQSASIQPASVPIGTIVLMSFAPTAPAAAVQKLLEDDGLSVVSGPAAGYYAVRIGARDMPSAEVDAMIARLSGQRDVIRSVVLQAPPD